MKRLLFLFACCSCLAATERDFRDRQAAERLQQTIEQENLQADADYEAWKLRQHDTDPAGAIYGLVFIGIVGLAVYRIVLRPLWTKKEKPLDVWRFR